MSRNNTIKMINNHYNTELIEKNKIPDRKYTPAEIFMKCTQNSNIEDFIKNLT